MIFPFSFWGAFSPKSLPNLSAWYDVSDFSSLRVDSANRVALVGDKSGNSGVNCLVLNGATSNNASTPDSAALSIVGDITVDVFARLPDWTPSAGVCPISKAPTGSNASYDFFVNPTALVFRWTPTGSTGAFVSATSTAAAPFADFAAGWVRATLDVNNGLGGWTVRFFTSTDGASWTQLGADVTGVGVTSIFDSTSALVVGGSNGGNSNIVTGNVFRVRLYSGYQGTGTVAFDANFSLAAKLATSFTESSANAATVTINTSGATGARISGERDLYQGTVANQPIYLPYTGSKYAFFNGTAGNFLSAPDSAALDITGDIDIRVFAALNDWTPAANNALVGKWAASNNSYVLFIAASSGVPALSWSTNGATVVTASATAAPVISDYGSIWVRVTLDVNNGAGGYTAIFYTSSDGSNWTQLGSAVVGGTTTSIFSGTGPLEVGSVAVGTSSNASGRIFRAQVYNGINGTLAFDFNAQSYTTGSTLVDQSVNAATITINGGATIVTAPALYFDGTNDYLKAPPFALSQPETVQFVFSRISQKANFTNIFDGNSMDSGTLYWNVNSNTSTLFAGTNGPSTLIDLKTRRLVSSVINGASSILRINKISGATGSCGSSNMNGITVGCRGDLAAISTINVAANEIAIYSAAQSTAQLDQFANYAGRKWGFTV